VTSLAPATPLTLEDARALRAAGDWRTLAARGAALHAAQLQAEPELAYAYAAACRQLGDTSRALEVAGWAEAGARRQGDRRRAAEAVNLVGNALFEEGRLDEAEARFGELLAYASEWSDEEFGARASNNLGILANVRGRRDLALASYQRALASYQRLGNVLGLAQTHHNLGISYRDLGFDREADAHFRRAVDLARADGPAAAARAAETDTETVIAVAEAERAMLRVRSGDAALAEALATRALQRFERIGDPRGRADVLRVLAAAARAGGRDEAAFPFLDEALDIARAHSDPLLMAEVQRDRGLLLRDGGDADGARAALTESAEHFGRLGATAEAEAVTAIVRGME
jgi:tetratricopeptide (TPR) repeat protein